MAFLVGILDGSKDVWGVRVPDVHGCHGGGATPEEAIRDAISALCELSEEIRDLKPRDAATIANDPAAAYDACKGESFVLLPVLSAGGIPSKANVSIDKRQLEAIDSAAKARGLTRSAFFLSRPRSTRSRPSAAEGMKAMNTAAAKTGPHPDFPMPHPGASIAVSLAAMEEPKTVIAGRLGISCGELHDPLKGKSVIAPPMASRLERVSADRPSSGSGFSLSTISGRLERNVRPSAHTLRNSEFRNWLMDAVGHPRRSHGQTRAAEPCPSDDFVIHI